MALAMLTEAEMMYRQFQKEERNRRLMERMQAIDPMVFYRDSLQPINSGPSWMQPTMLGVRGEWPLDGMGAGIADTPRPVPAKPSTKMLDVVETAELDMDNARVGLAVEVEDLLGYSALRKDVKAPSKLHRILAELEIDVYADDTVAQYKEKMQKHFQVKADNADRERIQKTLGRGRMTQTVVSWKLVDLARYGKPVPEHVLRKCVQIKKAAPEATFHVDELVEETRTLDPFMVVQLGEDRAVIEVWDEPTFEE